MSNSTRATAATATATATAAQEAIAPCNEVLLRGRLAAPADERELPSGDIVATFRLIVDRVDARASSVRVDTLECAAFRPPVRRRLLAAEAGDVLEVAGSLRRRFFRSAAGAASRYEVEVRSVTRVARAAR